MSGGFRMDTFTIQAIVDKQFDQALGHLIYVVREGEVVFYVGQSKRDVVTRFWEHIQKRSRLGQLIELNRPSSLTWLVDFYTLADCRPYVTQKSLFAMQAWETFDMDMAEQALIAWLRPILNRNFNANPTPLPAHYHGHELLGQRLPASLLHEPAHRPWLNRMSLAGWVYVQDGDGCITWRHHDGRLVADREMALFRQSGRIP
jgi:hypothetical protein